MDKQLSQINESLIEIFDSVMKIEQISLSQECFKNISMTEVHTIVAIGISELKNMSEIAKELRITVGTLTVAINNLVKKGYVERYKSESDRRIVKLGLTKQGKLVYRVHDKFHHNLVDEFVDGLDGQEKEILLGSLTKLQCFINEKYFV